MCNASKVKYLKWDSDFWNVNFYELIDETDINSYDILKPFIVQRKVETTDFNEIDSLVENGFEFVERKLIFEKTVTHERYLVDQDIHSVQIRDIENIKCEIGSMFVGNSRYRMLDQNKVEEFYYRWLVNSCLGTMDKYVDGYYMENQLAGFISYRVVDTVLVIGLFGVLNQFQGKGIASILLAHVNDTASQMKLDRISVSTQASNEQAIAVYEKNGYEMQNEAFWYYKMNLTEENKHDSI